jgi:oxygen-dependent protoporphyrinogen oxidase
MNKRITIIGGGITGLAAAYRLQKTLPEADITLLEATNHLGGKIGTEQFDGFVMEWGPDCFLSRKPRGIGLCQELGITAELVGRNSQHAKTFVLRNRRLHRLPEGLTGLIPTNLEALKTSTLLSESARERLARELSIPPKPANGDESVAAFISRRLGQETFENLVEPLMAGIYAGQANELSLAATFPQLRQLELDHGSLLGGLTNRPPTKNVSDYPPFVSFPNGMQALVTRLVECLEEVEILKETAVSNIYKAANGYRLSVNGGKRIDTNALIITAPTFVSGRILEGVDSQLAHLLSEIPYVSTALVNLAFNEADVPELDGYGYVIPNVEDREALACTWTSRKWQNRAPDGKVLIRVYIGRFGRPDVTEYDDDRLLNIAFNEISQTLDITAEPLFSRIIRYPKAMPQYNLGHLERLAAIENQLAQHPGLFLAGAAFNGVGIPDCIASGEQAAESASNYLRNTTINYNP